MAPAEKSVVEILEVTCERNDAGKFGIPIEELGGNAYVCKMSGEGVSLGQLQPGDHITHVDGKGPFRFKKICAELKVPNKVVLTVVRGEEPPKPSRFSTSRMMGCSLAILVCAVSWSSLVELPLASSTLGVGVPEEPRESRTRTPRSQETRGEGQVPADAIRRPAMMIGGQKFIMEEDGSASDPVALRNAMRSDKYMMAELRKNEPDWARIVAGRPDGSFDEKAFQKMLRKNFAGYQKSEALKRNEDGTAVDAEAYLAAARKDKQWLKWLRGAYPQFAQEVLDGNLEALQYALKTDKVRAEPPPPPPATPYDDMGQVGMSMRILTDEGEEKDLYTLSAKEVEEEKFQFPQHMACAACQAAAHQGAVAVSGALKRMYKGDLVGVTSLEAMQDLCSNVGLWTQEYSVVPTKAGVNAISGPGVTKTDSFEGDTSVMLQSMHSDMWGRRLATACSTYLLGAEQDEDELAAAAMAANEAGDDEAAPLVFKEMLCEKPGQACAAAAA